MGDTEKSKDVQIQSIELGSQDSSQEQINAQTTSRVPAAAWPQEPVPLTPNKHERIALVLYDIVLVAVPLLLILKIIGCIVCWKVDQKYTNNEIDSVHPLTKFLVQFNEQLVTIFTIVFVTIISTLVRRYALFKAQKGAYVSDLEQLQGSISLTSTLKLVWSLRSWSKQSIVLCLIWCFYYLGSQAAKREFALADSGPSWWLSAASFNSSGPSFFNPPPIRDATVTGDPSEINNLFLRSSIVLDYKDNTVDLSRGSDIDGWPLVPNIDWMINPDADYGSSLPASPQGSPAFKKAKHLEPDRHGWISVSTQSKNMYTSLTGQPIFTYNRAQNFTTKAKIVGTFNYKTAYLNIGCSVAVQHKYEDFPNKMANGTILRASMNMIMNDVAVNATKDIWGHPLRTFELWGRWPNGTYSDSNGTYVGPGSFRSICNITTTHVEVDVSCVQVGCVPVRMRYRDPSQINSPSVLKLNNTVPAINAISYSTPFDNKDYANNFFSNLTLSTGPAADDSGFTRIFNYLTLGGVPYYFWYSQSTSYACTYCDDLNFYTRNTLSPSMSFWFNTYAQIGQYSNAAYPFADVLAKTGSDGTYNPVLLKGALYSRAYYIYWQWIAIDFVSCLVLLIAGILCYWLRVHTLAPDIFGYVSSLTRDNPYFDLPDNGSTLSGLDRARLMKRVKVKIGDLNADQQGDVGRIGLARLDTGSRQIVGLTREKAYI